MTTSNFYLKQNNLKQWKWHYILLFQLFGPTSMGSFAVAGARLADVNDYFFLNFWSTLKAQAIVIMSFFSHAHIIFSLSLSDFYA